MRKKDDLELFNNDALTENLKYFISTFSDDCLNITDLRFLILRFCIILEKATDTLLFEYKKDNQNEILSIEEIQFLNFKFENQKGKKKYSKIKTFAEKISFLQSICKHKNVELDFINLIDFIKTLRNIVAHQLINPNDLYNFIIENKEVFNINFIKLKNIDSNIRNYLYIGDFFEKLLEIILNELYLLLNIFYKNSD